MTITVETTFEITDTMLYDMIVTVWEGGSNYWIDDYEFAKDKEDEALQKRVRDAVDASTLDDKEFLTGSPVPQRAWKVGSIHLYAFLMFEPAILRIMPDGAEEIIVGRDDWSRGFTIMAEKFPRHWQDFVNDNSDVITADVWFQCVCFGDVIYS
jgi:hypothetical protein